MNDPNMWLLTWTTYGTWLPGDARGWTARGGHKMAPDPDREEVARAVMAQEPFVLNTAQRQRCLEAMRDHALLRGWVLFAATVRTNHVHQLVASAAPPERVMKQMKDCCTRALRDTGCIAPDRKVWTKGGSAREVMATMRADVVATYIIERQGENCPGTFLVAT